MFLLLRVLLLCIFPAMAVAATAPAITASAATPTPGADGAETFSATVTANGALTSVVFEYGKTIGYGTRTAPVFVSEVGVAVTVSVPVSGLVGGREYHFRVVAQNDAGTKRTTDAMFTARAFAPALTIQKATDVAGAHATLKAIITSNGSTGTALFQYTDAANFDAPLEKFVQQIDGTEEAKALSVQVEGLLRNTTYRFRLVLAGTDFSSGSETFHTNQLPVARPDTFGLRGLRPTSLDVLKNDSDKDGDARLVSATSSAANGVVTQTADGLRLVYAPGAKFRGTDGFTYTITDGFPASTATAAVTIRSFGILLGGNHGGLLLDADGEAVGYFKLTTTESGAFSGSVRVNGEKRSVAGKFGPDGIFRGSVEIDGRTVPLALEAKVNGGATTLEVDFDDGRFTAALHTTEASPALRAELAGRYTVEFPSGTTTSDPANDGSVPTGSGWALLKLGTDGVARVKGRLPDARTFSTRGVLSATTDGGVITFFDDPRRTRVAGTLSIDDALTGTLNIFRDSGGSGLFADGYGLQSTASGARYVQPEDGKRAIEGLADASGRRLSFSVTGSNPAETFTRELWVDEDDRVKVLDRDSEHLTVKIDRDSGRFTVWFTGATDNQRIKGTGVFIQGSTSGALGRGAGVFTGDSGMGKISITAGGSTTTTDTDTTVR